MHFYIKIVHMFAVSHNNKYPIVGVKMCAFLQPYFKCLLFGRCPMKGLIIC